MEKDGKKTNASMKEMTNLKPLLPGDSEIDQIFRIFRLLGTPTSNSWANGVKYVFNIFFRFILVFNKYLFSYSGFNAQFPRWRPRVLGRNDFPHLSAPGNKKERKKERLKQL